MTTGILFFHAFPLDESMWVPQRAARLHGRWLTPTVTWTRHFAPAAIEGAGDPARIAFLRESWQAAAVALAGISGTSLPASAPAPLAQLDVARRHGVAVEDPGDEIGPEAPGSPHWGLWFHDPDGYRWELSVQDAERQAA